MRLAGLVLLIALAPGCRQDMHDQPKYEPLEPSTFFEDGRALAPPVEGTVARGFLREDAHFFTGKTGGSHRPGARLLRMLARPLSIGSTGLGNTADPNRSSAVTAQYQGFAAVFPMPVTQELMDRGEERYNIFCSRLSCRHRRRERDGGQARLSESAFVHDDRLRQAPVGYFFDVITNGFGAMPDYSAQITPETVGRSSPTFARCN